MMSLIWAGIDIGKTHHHCVVLDAAGSKLLSRRVVNGEPELLELLGDVLVLGDEVTWAIDVVDGIAALLITVLLNHRQRVVHIPGLAVNRATAGYRGQGKTDARDALVIADQARMRRDLNQVRPADEITTELNSPPVGPTWSKTGPVRSTGCVACSLESSPRSSAHWT